MEREVMERLGDIFNAVVMCAGVGFLALVALLYAAYALRDAAGRLKKWLGSSAVAALIAVCAVWYGGSKSVRFDTGLTNAGSYATNDTIHIAWTYRGIPAASDIYIDARECWNTNGEWRTIGQTVASALSWDGTLANATNWDYWVYSDYVPPVPVHTNGVWVGQMYETKERKGANGFLLINGRLTEHGRDIAPPNAKRKEDEP